MQSSDNVLDYYIKKIDSVRFEFPSLMSSEFDSVVQNAVDDWVDEEERYLSEHFSQKTEEAIDIIRRIKQFDPGFDGSQYLERLESGDGEKVKEELLGILESLEDDAVRKHLDESSGRLIDTLRKWFKRLSSLDTDTRRCLWGMNVSDFRSGMLTDIEKYAKVFRNDPAVKRFTDILGRRIAVQDGNGSFLSLYGDVRIQGMGAEIIGVELGRDISNIVPSELSQMNDDDLGILFDLKYVEGRLMSFSREDSIDTEQDDGGDLPIPGRMGPIIIICDTSGSMYGRPLFLSKALCFTAISRAAAQGRDILRIDFNVRSRSTDITPNNHIRELHRFLTMRASGGTDPRSAMKEAVRMIEDERYMNADVIVISDFGLDMSNFSRGNRSMIALRENGCRIHSVIVPSRRSRKMNEFDTNWGIDSRKGAGTFAEL